MKQTIDPGAYGWLHPHWKETFYPADLPEDWRLGYYSNEFNTVLVPVDYWRGMKAGECGHWLDDVHENFQFYIECHGRLFDMISPAELTEALLILKPQLSGLVFLGEEQMSSMVKDQFTGMIEKLGVAVFGAEFGSKSEKIWRPGCVPEKNPDLPHFAFVADDLTDLRSCRQLIEPFTMRLSEGEAVIIVSHPRLQATDLAKFRSVLEIMGY